MGRKRADSGFRPVDLRDRLEAYPTLRHIVVTVGA